MVDRDEVCVLIPTYNEAETIGDVVAGFTERGFDTVLVMDGGSTDGTREIAADHGARVEQQSGDGKGQAIREAFTLIEADVVLMLDGDATYRPADAERLLEPIFAGRAEHVVGNRFADMEPGAMPRLNRVGNRLINRAFRFIHGRDLADILSGYRAFTLESVQGMSLSASGFGIETELSVECVKHNVRTEVVPITYRPRPSESQANLRPVRDGAVIIYTLYKMAKTNNPLFYFGSLGAISTLAGLGLAVYVVVEWFTKGVSHEVLAIGAGVGVLFGVQLLMFGVLSDLIVTVNREQTRQFEQLADRLAAGEQGPARAGPEASEQPGFAEEGHEAGDEGGAEEDGGAEDTDHADDDVPVGEDGPGGSEGDPAEVQ